MTFKDLVFAAILFFCGSTIVQAVSTSLSYDRLLGRLLMPMAEGDMVHNTAAASVGTTEIEAVTADVASAFRTKDNLQIVTLTNLHASQNLCFFQVDYNSEDCNTTCAAETVTCDGTAASDGAYILPSTQRTFTLFGDQCACVVGSAASTTFSADRVYR